MAWNGRRTRRAPEVAVNQYHILPGNDSPFRASAVYTGDSSRDETAHHRAHGRPPVRHHPTRQTTVSLRNTVHE